jgi:hypothetical protein
MSQVEVRYSAQRVVTVTITKPNAYSSMELVVPEDKVGTLIKALSEALYVDYSYDNADNRYLYTSFNEPVELTIKNRNIYSEGYHEYIKEIKENERDSAS